MNRTFLLPSQRDLFCRFLLKYTEELGYQDFEETESSGLDKIGTRMKLKQQRKEISESKSPYSNSGVSGIENVSDYTSITASSHSSS